MTQKGRQARKRSTRKRSTKKVDRQDVHPNPLRVSSGIVPSGPLGFPHGTKPFVSAPTIDLVRPLGDKGTDGATPNEIFPSVKVLRWSFVAEGNASWRSYRCKQTNHKRELRRFPCIEIRNSWRQKIIRRSRRKAIRIRRQTAVPQQNRPSVGFLDSRDRGGTDEKFTANGSSFAHKVTFRRSSKPPPATLRNRFR
jgi:hypothetical protein